MSTRGRKKTKKPKHGKVGNSVEPQSALVSIDDDLLSSIPKRNKGKGARSWLHSRGARLVTLKTPYGEATYLETPDMRWRSQNKFDDNFFKKPYVSNLGGTGGGDYLQLGSRL